MDRKLWARRVVPLLALGTAWCCALAGDHQRGKAAEGLAFFFSLGVGLTAFVAWARAAFPATAAAADKVVEGNAPWRTFWVGLVNALAAAALIALLGTVGKAFPPAGLAALALLGLTAVVAFRGALAIWPSYGHLVLGRDAAATDLQATMAGGALLTGILLLFPVGLAFFAYVVARSLGTSVLAWIESRGAPPVS